MNIKTYGDLMDMANATSNDKLKAQLRDSFQSWCKANGAMPFDPSTVARWRSELVSGDVGDLIMTAFGLDEPEEKTDDSKLSVEELRKKYPEGTEIELVYMDDFRYGIGEFKSLQAGTRGTVDHVDDMGTIHMKWETGSSLGLCPEVDKFRVVKEV